MFPLPEFGENNSKCLPLAPAECAVLLIVVETEPVAHVSPLSLFGIVKLKVVFVPDVDADTEAFVQAEHVVVVPTENAFVRKARNQAPPCSVLGQVQGASRVCE